MIARILCALFGHAWYAPEGVFTARNTCRRCDTHRWGAT